MEIKKGDISQKLPSNTAQKLQSAVEICTVFISVMTPLVSDTRTGSPNIIHLLNAGSYDEDIKITDTQSPTECNFYV